VKQLRVTLPLDLIVHHNFPRGANVFLHPLPSDNQLQNLAVPRVVVALFKATGVQTTYQVVGLVLFPSLQLTLVLTQTGIQ
jgi:hypothetical protein